MEFSIDERNPLPGRMEVQVSSFEPNVVDGSATFSVDQYLRKNEKGQWSLQKKYNHYQFINQLP
jgi:hypothetical protein